MKEHLKDLLIILVIVAIAFVAIDPFLVITSTELYMMILLVLGAVLVGSLILFWRKNPVDERDELHKNQAGRITVIGNILMSLGVLAFQILTDDLDKWIFVLIVNTTLVYIVARMFLRER